MSAGRVGDAATATILAEVLGAVPAVVLAAVLEMVVVRRAWQRSVGCVVPAGLAVAAAVARKAAAIAPLVKE